MPDKSAVKICQPHLSSTIMSFPIYENFFHVSRLSSSFLTGNMRYLTLQILRLKFQVILHKNVINFLLLTSFILNLLYNMNQKASLPYILPLKKGSKHINILKQQYTFQGSLYILKSVNTILNLIRNDYMINSKIIS